MSRNKNIWKSLLITLAINNLVMVVIWTIMSAFGYHPHYLMSLVIHNAVAVCLVVSDFWEGLIKSESGND